MRHIALVLALASSACVNKYVTPPTVPVGEKRVEAIPLPPDPATEDMGTFCKSSGLPESPPCPDAAALNDQRVEPLEQGDPAPFAGLIFGEGRVYRDGLYRIRYRELRSNYEADRKVWVAHRELYETRLGLADKAIRDLQPNWWERNAFTLGVFGGTTLGIVMSVAIFAVAN
jgi:hypothetical protein